jgi:hypothetical protein
MGLTSWTAARADHGKGTRCGVEGAAELYNKGPNRANMRNAKSEIRNPKSETNSKHEIRYSKRIPVASGFLNFGFWICFGFRISDFLTKLGHWFPTRRKKEGSVALDRKWKFD